MDNVNLVFKRNISSKIDIKVHLTKVNQDFVPALSKRVDINAYSLKLFNNSQRFECWLNNILIGLVCIYIRNDNTNSAYVSNVSVLREYSQKGIAIKLMNFMLNNIENQKVQIIELHVGEMNIKALELYKKLDFKILRMENKIITMVKEINS